MKVSIWDIKTENVFLTAIFLNQSIVMQITFRAFATHVIISRSSRVGYISDALHLSRTGGDVWEWMSLRMNELTSRLLWVLVLTRFPNIIYLSSYQSVLMSDRSWPFLWRKPQRSVFSSSSHGGLAQRLCQTEGNFLSIGWFRFLLSHTHDSS